LTRARSKGIICGFWWVVDMRFISALWEGIRDISSDLWVDHGGKVKLFLAFFVSLAAFGFFLGRYHSPDYRDDTDLQDYMARKSYKSALTEDIVDGPYSLTYICDARAFNYITLDEDNVRVLTVSESERVPSVRRTTTFTDVLLLLAGGAKSDLFKLKQLSVAAWQNIPVKQRALQGVIAFVVAGSGFGVGYYYGYDKRLDCKEGSVQKNLNDPAFWKAVATDVREATRAMQARVAAATQ
jgi:hypothetical protein